MRSVPDRPETPGSIFKTGEAGLSAGETDLLFQNLISFSKLALAVSGGADSLSLLVLFDEWRQRHSWAGQAEVLTVDHGLRPESTAEAVFVERQAMQRGLSCTVLRWEGEKPSRNRQEAARLARYRLIAGRMRETGAEALLVAHHLDDQAETFLDRLTRGSGISGLSAMAPDETDGPEGLRILRPFLDVPKARLQACLLERGLEWCSDPSNLDDKYKRTRLRRILELLAQEGLGPERIAGTVRRMRSARSALETAADRIFATDVEEHPAGPLRLNRETYRDKPEDLRLRLLGRIIRRATGLRTRLRLEKLLLLDTALVAHTQVRQTLAGCLFEAGEDWLWCWKEAGRVPPETVPAQAGEGIWDARYRYLFRQEALCGSPEDCLFLGPLCAAPVLREDVAWPQGWPKDAFACAPVLWSAKHGAYRHGLSVELPMGREGACQLMRLDRLPGGQKGDANHVPQEDFIEGN